MHRIAFSLVAALLLFGVTGASTFSRQEATPTSDLAGLGLPELVVNASATGYEGIPASTPAGRYLVTVTATEDTGDDGAGVAFVQPPEGMTTDDFFNSFAPPEDGASPVAEDEGDSGAPPAEIYQAKFAGGIAVAAGSTAQFVVDLTPGDWIAWADNPEAPQTPFVFEATGEMPADLPEPETSATLTMAEYAITVSEGALIAGPQIIKIDNVGAQPHFILMASGPDTMTEADIEAVLNADMTGTPAAVGFNPDTDIQDVLVTGTQSRGTSTWVPVDLEPGKYVLVCFFPDISDGMPHAYHGMYAVVEVAA
jgi:hypothetical protein